MKVELVEVKTVLPRKRNNVLGSNFLKKYLKIFFSLSLILDISERELFSTNSIKDYLLPVLWTIKIIVLVNFRSVKIYSAAILVFPSLRNNAFWFGSGFNRNIFLF